MQPSVAVSVQASNVIFSQMLHALGLPQAELFNPDDINQVKSLLTWLENTKIRQYPAESRSNLEAAELATFDAALVHYASDLDCPLSLCNNDRRQIIKWILRHAISLEYQDHADDFNTIVQHVVDGSVPAEASPLLSPPAFPDALAEDIAPKIFEALHALHIPASECSVPELLNKLESALQTQILPALLRQSSGDAELAPFPLGFSTGDEIVDKAATILRMLYIKDLRELQTFVDRGIVEVQEMTAQARTDASLGKVGR